MKLFLALFLAAPLAAQLGWPSLERDHKPWTRWWWHGSAVDRDTIIRELDEMAAAGIGGVEITPIYGAKGAERRFIPYLSPTWIDMVAFTAQQAARRGMAVDLTPGSGWRIGGPFVDPGFATTAARIQKMELASGERLRIEPGQTATAYPDGGKPVLLAPGDWTAPAHTSVFVLTTAPSGEKVKRAAPGGEGLTIDIFSAAAFRKFFTEFDQRIARLPRGSIRAWFHDSFEYTGNWSPELFEAFERYRGYDLRPHLRELAGRGDPDAVGRVLSDYRETLSDMLRDNAIIPLSAWARSRGGLSRNQAHGSPGNLLDLYAASDIPETEIFGRIGNPDNDPLVNKFASSAAHLAGKRLTSSETFTWLNEHFHTTLDEMKRATDQVLLAGVNHILFHGTAYSPPDVPWPGWVFYASTQVNPRNPIWRDLPALNAYIARCQSVLQGGRPSNEVLLYWPYHDAIEAPGPMFQQLGVNDPVWFLTAPVSYVARGLWDRGYSFDYVSDALLERVAFRNGALEAGSARYRTILIPEVRRMPLDTLRRLLSLVESGASIVFFKHLPEDVPGLARLEERRSEFRRLLAGLRFEMNRGVMEARSGAGRVLIASALDRGLLAAGARREVFTATADTRQDLFDTRLQFLRRQREDGGFDYFLVNQGASAFDGWLPLAADFRAATLLDPMSGRVGRAAVRDGSVRLQLDPTASVIVRTSMYESQFAEAWRYREPAGPPVTLEGQWRVTFLEGGPKLPAAFSSSRIGFWTERGGDFESFAGTARYALRFRHTGGRALLDLGEVRDSARVRLNGQQVAVPLVRPFRVELERLTAGENLLEVEVTNVAANRIRDLDRHGAPWKIFYDINIVNMRYQPLDASGWPVRDAGLLGPVKLTPLR
jgi:hypothetical protein